MSVIAFKQSTTRKAVQEAKENARAAVRKRRRAPLLFRNGFPESPVRLFGLSRGPITGYLSQADIDRTISSSIPLYSNQYAAKVMRGEIRRGFWERLRGRLRGAR